MQYIFRTISIIYVIIVIIPLFIIRILSQCIFDIFNNFTYQNFVDSDAQLLEMAHNNGIDMKYYGFLKIWTLATHPILEFFLNLVSGIKSIKF